MRVEMRLMPDPTSPTGYSMRYIMVPETPQEKAIQSIETIGTRMGIALRDVAARPGPLTSQVEGAKRGAGLGARAVARGVTGLADIVSPLSRIPYYLATGEYIPSVTESADAAMTQAGLPMPSGPVEGSISGLTSALTGGAGFAGGSMMAANALRSAGPVVAGATKALADMPLRQLFGSLTGEGSRQVAEASGAGPIGQTVAALGGGMVPFIGARGPAMPRAPTAIPEPPPPLSAEPPPLPAAPSLDALDPMGLGVDTRRPNLSRFPRRDLPPASIMDLLPEDPAYARELERISALEAQVGTPGLDPRDAQFIRKHRVQQRNAAPLPQAPPPATPTAPPAPKGFAEQINEIARGVETSIPEGGKFTHKASIAEIYDAYGRKQPDAGSLEEFKARLLDAHNKGEIDLLPLNDPKSMDPALRARSAIKTKYNDYHFVDRRRATEAPQAPPPLGGTLYSGLDPTLVGKMFGKRNEMGFFRPLERALDTPKAPTKADAATWTNWLRNQPGVKAEEIEWTGVNDWLATRQGPVTRDEVANYVQQNGVRVEEVRLDEWRQRGTSDYWRRVQAIQAEMLPLIDENDRLMREMVRLGDAPEAETLSSLYNQNEIRIQELRLDRADIASRSNDANATKWSSFTLPGGENYTELLLKLPAKPREAAPWVVEQRPDGWDVVQRMDNSTNSSGPFRSEAQARSEMDRLNDEAIQRSRGNQRDRANSADFQSSHWSEPNVLAHVRFKDRTGPNGERILALEEVQSDWHQAGRERGYATEATEAELQAKATALRGQVDELTRQLREPTAAEFVRGVLPGGREQLAQLEGQYRDALQQLDRVNRITLVPDAPFKNNAWAALALKRVIAKAADEGYDSVAWIPGTVKNGKQTAEPQDGWQFYDQILPNIANDIGKKYGARSGRVNLDGVDFHELRLTPQMRETIRREGLSLFALPGALAIGAGAGLAAQDKKKRLPKAPPPKTIDPRQFGVGPFGVGPPRPLD